MSECKVSDCVRTTSHGGYGYCIKHYHHMVRNGKILKRTRMDRNQIIDCGDYCEIILYDVNNKEIGRTKIDKKYVDKISKYKWCLNDSGYAITNANYGKKRLHHYILPRRGKDDVDHIDCDKLNNLKSNLRYSTHKQNCSNRKNVKGYTWDKDRKKWSAQIMVNYKHIGLGRFENRQDAITARRKAEIKYFGEFAYKYN